MYQSHRKLVVKERGEKADRVKGRLFLRPDVNLNISCVLFYCWGFLTEGKSPFKERLKIKGDLRRRQNKIEWIKEIEGRVWGRWQVFTWLGGRMSELLTRGPNWRKFSLNGLYQFCELCYHIYDPRNPFSLLSLIKKEVRKKRGDFFSKNYSCYIHHTK